MKRRDFLKLTAAACAFPALPKAKVKPILCECNEKEMRNYAETLGWKTYQCSRMMDV